MGARKFNDGICAMVEAAREIRRVYEAQRAYVRELQELAAEARRLGTSQSHRLPAPRAHDYGNGVEMLLLALEKYERAAKLPTTVTAPPTKIPPATGAVEIPGEPLMLMPCEHFADYRDLCPSWGPVDGCKCPPGSHAAPPKKGEGG